MTVSTVVNHEQYTGNGVTTVFPYRFRILKTSHMVVTVSDTAGVLTTLINGTDYTITGVGLVTGGNVVLSSALADGWLISLDRDLPAVQETDLRNQGRFFAETHEDAFDYLTMLVQRSLSLFGLALRKPSWIANYYDANGNRISNLKDPAADSDAVTKRYADSLTEADFIRSLRVPEKSVNVIPGVALRKNMILGFDESGNPKVLLPPNGSASDVLLQLASTEDGKGDSLIGVRQPFDGAIPRTQHDKNAETLNVLDFGVVPDSTADQSAAILKAIAAAAGRTLIFPKGTFVAALGTLTTSVNLVGQGHSNTIIKRPASSPAGIVKFSGNASYSVKGICFDGNKANNTVDADNVTLSTSVINFDFDGNRSTNVKGGSGFVAGDNNANKKSYGIKRFSGNRFDNADSYGCLITQISSFIFLNNECDSNILGGFASSWNVYPPVSSSQSKVIIDGNQFHDNGTVGCFIIGFIEGGKATAPLYGSATNANYRIFVTNNFVASNKSHGLVVQANEFFVSGNICEYNGDYNSADASAFSGLLVNGAYGVVDGNFIMGNSGFGIDMGGSKFCTVNNNTITENATGNKGGNIGLNLGGCQYLTASSNLCSLNGNDAYGVQIMIPGYDGGSTSFQTLTTAVHVTGNTCVLGSGSSRIGIKFYGRPLQCSASANKVSGGFVNNAYIFQTNEPVAATGNLVDSPMPSVDIQAGLVVPDDMETFLINGGGTITNLLTYSHYTYRQKVSETYVVNQGSGYDPLNPPAVTISGGGGTGATAVAAVDGSGKVITVNVVNAGSGYTGVPTITIAPPASGTTATAIARVGVVNFTGRKLTLYFNAATTLQSVNNIYLPSTPLSVPAKGVVKLLGTADGQFVLSSKSF